MLMRSTQLLAWRKLRTNLNLLLAVWGPKNSLIYVLF